MMANQEGASAQALNRTPPALRAGAPQAWSTPVSSAPEGWVVASGRSMKAYGASASAQAQNQGPCRPREAAGLTIAPDNVRAVEWPVVGLLDGPVVQK